MLDRKFNHQNRSSGGASHKSSTLPPGGHLSCLNDFDDLEGALLELNSFVNDTSVRVTEERKPSNQILRQVSAGSSSRHTAPQPSHDSIRESISPTEQVRLVSQSVYYSDGVNSGEGKPFTLVTQVQDLQIWCEVTILIIRAIEGYLNF